MTLVAFTAGARMGFALGSLGYTLSAHFLSKSVLSAGSKSIQLRHAITIAIVDDVMNVDFPSPCFKLQESSACARGAAGSTLARPGRPDQTTVAPSCWRPALTLLRSIVERGVL